jgi:hypothetical protein
MLEEFDEQLKAHGLEIIVRETSTGFAWRIDLRLTPTTWDEEGDQVFQMRDGWHYRIGGSVFGTWLDEGAALAEMQAEQRRRRARGWNGNVVAKAPRSIVGLSRNRTFFANLMESKVKFVAWHMPKASQFEPGRVFSGSTVFEERVGLACYEKER